jgi:hypothetical protein
LLIDLDRTRRAAGAHLEGRLALEPWLAEELLGKTWRDEELETVGGLELMEVAYTTTNDGEFVVQTSYLAELNIGALYVERQITPVRLRTPPKPSHRLRLCVDDAGLYPGAPPRRLKLRRARREPLTRDDVERLLAHAPREMPELRQNLVDQLANPFGLAESAVLFRPADIVAQAEQVRALDSTGRSIQLEWLATSAQTLASLLPAPGSCALFGHLSLDGCDLRLRVLAAIGALEWDDGPLYRDPSGPGLS